MIYLNHEADKIIVFTAKNAKRCAKDAGKVL
jgi:hypothetical protein